MSRPARAGTLRFRLLAGTIIALGAALVMAGFALTGLFRSEVTRQFRDALTLHLDQLTARIEFDAEGRPVVDEQALSDPRWHRPFSGLYWQVDGRGDPGALRSRSLWDTTLSLDPDTIAPGEIHVHARPGPSGAPLLVLERAVHPIDRPAEVWRLIVAGDSQSIDAAVLRFSGVLAASLAVLFLLLAAAGWAQVSVGLAPLRTLARTLADVRQGRAQRLTGRFPLEVQPLIDEFNAVLDRNAAVVERARRHAGNLAHAVKTPLAVLEQAGAADDSSLAGLVREQTGVARRQVDWHLARSRAAAAQRMPGQRTPIGPVIDGLLRVMSRVHAEKALRIRCQPLPDAWAFAGESQDLQEILGNVLENACKWARTRVDVRVAPDPDRVPPEIVVVVEDDGPGIDAERRSGVLSRGARLDETVPGSGLGLAIVADLVDIYEGRIALGPAPAGGLQVEIRLPACG